MHAEAARFLGGRQPARCPRVRHRSDRARPHRPDADGRRRHDRPPGRRRLQLPDAGRVLQGGGARRDEPRARDPPHRILTGVPLVAVTDLRLESMLEANRRYAAGFAAGGRPALPARQLVILTCMDARINVEDALGLEIGDAHILRNAGGRATDDAIRSLVVSANWLGTRRALVIHHTQCGLFGQTNVSMREHVRDVTGHDPVDIEFHAIADLEESVREDVRRIGATPFLPDGYEVRGAIYDVDTGALIPVSD